MKHIKMIVVISFILFSSKSIFSQSIDIAYGRVFDYPKMFTIDCKVGLPILIHKEVLVTPYGGWKTWAMWSKSSGDPFRDTYQIGTKIEYQNFYIDFNHYCTHDVVGDYMDDEPVSNGKWMYGKQWDQHMTTINFGYKKTFDTWEIF
jgi:hypothetical protein